MKKETLNQTITRIGLDTCDMVISKMKRGQKVNGSKLSIIISDICNINEITFENSTTESLHKMIFTQLGMDQNGNWTRDENKWA
mgnify:CR=1 FL=1